MNDTEQLVIIILPPKMPNHTINRAIRYHYLIDYFDVGIYIS